MFVGHVGVGFAAKRIAPQVSLGSLFLAVQFADGLWPILLLAGIEHVRIVPGLMKASATHPVGLLDRSTPRAAHPGTSLKAARAPSGRLPADISRRSC